MSAVGGRAAVRHFPAAPSGGRVRRRERGGSVPCGRSCRGGV